MIIFLGPRLFKNQFVFFRFQFQRLVLAFLFIFFLLLGLVDEYDEGFDEHEEDEEKNTNFQSHCHNDMCTTANFFLG